MFQTDPPVARHGDHCKLAGLTGNLDIRIYAVPTNAKIPGKKSKAAHAVPIRILQIKANTVRIHLASKPQRGELNHSGCYLCQPLINLSFDKCYKFPRAVHP